MSDTTAHHAHQGTNKTVSPTARKGALAGIGVVIACAIACSIPLIAAGGVVAGIGAFLAGGGAVALGIVAVVGAVVTAAVWVRRRRTAAVAAADGASACGCGGAC